MTTLVIVDMQKDFIDGALANKAAQDIIPGIVELVNTNKYDKIIFTLDTHKTTGKENYLDSVEGKNLPVPHCIHMSDGWMLNESIVNAVNSKYDSKDITYLEKNTFGSKDLPSKIVDDENIQVDFVGTCTGICVINNVAMVKAFYPNADINVYHDLCACITEESHNRAIEQMKFNHINMKTFYIEGENRKYE